MALNLANNPKWLAAVQREREIRESAYLGLRTPIGVTPDEPEGVLSLAPLTLRQQIFLFAARNPIVAGLPATEADAGMFLWALHPEFSPTNLEGRVAYKTALQSANLPWEIVVADLRTYYVEQTLDSPRPKAQKSAESQAPAVCGAAFYVTEMSKEAGGCTREYILDSPIACLNQERRGFRMQRPRHGIIGGALSNAVEAEILAENPLRKAALAAAEAKNREALKVK